MNPTVETDLIGDYIHLFQMQHPGMARIGAGRVRAVTANGSHMNLWLEILKEEDGWTFGVSPHPLVGDILCVSTSGSNGYGDVVIRLIRGVA